MPQPSAVRPRSLGLPDASLDVCVGREGCGNPAIPDSPVPLCAHHLRKVFEFAEDLIATRLGRTG
jgi:hypothetical protein